MKEGGARVRVQEEGCRREGARGEAAEEGSKEGVGEGEIVKGTPEERKRSGDWAT